MNSSLSKETFDDLFTAILSIDNRDDCYDFFDDLCTIQELKSIAQRFHVARMLRDGMVYSEIVAQTGASTATISRVNRSLLYGCGGYDKVLSKYGDIPSSESLPKDR